MCEDEFDGDASDAGADEGLDFLADIGGEGGDDSMAEIGGEVDDLAVGHDAVSVVVDDGVVAAWAVGDCGGDLPAEAVGEEEVEGVVDGGEAQGGVVIADDAKEFVGGGVSVGCGEGGIDQLTLAGAANMVAAEEVADGIERGVHKPGRWLEVQRGGASVSNHT